MAIAWWALNNAPEHGKLHLGFIMAVTFLPVIIFGPFLGAVTDRHNKRHTMLLADLGRMFLVLTLGIFTYTGHLQLWILYMLCFCISGFGPMFEASVAGSLLKLTSPQHLGAATATDSSVSQISAVFGSALGSFFIAAIGTAGAFFFNSFTYFLSFVFVWFITTNLNSDANENSLYFSELKHGFAYIFENKPVLYLMLSFSIFNFFVGPILIIIPMLVKYILNDSVKWLAILETFFALGSAITALSLSFKSNYKNIYLWFFASLIIVAMSFGAIAFTQNKFIMCALLFICGCALGLGNAVALTLFQYEVPQNLKGRFFAVLTTVSYAVLPLTFMVNGLLADKVSVKFIIQANSTAVLLLSVLILFIPQIKYNTNGN